MSNSQYALPTPVCKAMNRIRASKTFRRSSMLVVTRARLDQARISRTQEVVNCRLTHKFPTATLLGSIFRLFVIVLVSHALSASCLAQESAGLEHVIQTIISRPEFRHARFGIEFYSLEAGRPIYCLHADEFFLAASTTKLVTEGGALDALGPDYRFHTAVYRTGPIRADGTLEGDLVLVAGGDPNLSSRVQPDGTLAFENIDHSNAGDPFAKVVPGDPLQIIRNLARQVVEKKISRIQGDVLVDTSLFSVPPDDSSLSPIVINDNIIDLLVHPGSKPGAVAAIEASPKTGYAVFTSQVITVERDSEAHIRVAADTALPNGTHAVTITGTVPSDQGTQLRSYDVTDPRRFAQIAFMGALRDLGVMLDGSQPGEGYALSEHGRNYLPENLVAEYVSPPFSEDVKVTLKVSQNLHAEMIPYLMGAIKGHSDDAKQAGFSQLREFLTSAGLDMTAAMSSSGAGGQSSFTPDFMVHYLAFMTKQPNYGAFLGAFPVLGRDGTLFGVALKSPAVGHVYAKTGTDRQWSELSQKYLVTSKGLAGYITTANSQHLVFAIYVNNIPVSRSYLDVLKIGQALGDIAAAAYEYPPSNHGRRINSHKR